MWNNAKNTIQIYSGKITLKKGWQNKKKEDQDTTKWL